nr:hypothetical protein CFP56_44594 [Quercus suber]
MVPPTKQSKVTKRSGHSHRGSLLTCYWCSEMKFNKDSEMESHNCWFHCKDSEQCRWCRMVYRCRRNLKFHKATTHGAKKKTTAEMS